MEIKYEWHAEDVGWPPKSSDTTINDNKIAVDFRPAIIAEDANLKVA